VEGFEPLQEQPIALVKKSLLGHCWRARKSRELLGRFVTDAEELLTGHEHLLAMYITWGRN